ncbi:hypothetical protein [Nocardioides sp. AX2bis]|uniref:hypothetical protein n=1 Tax=Nocardioides sp. AX2bis TaxID=2653157 RepID=UPI00135BEA87|nr:hypothetical protein [Nocardioides sp. AX2bis]
MARHRLVGTAGAVAALLLGAAACGGDPEPRFAPPTDQASPSASPTAPPSESAAPERLTREETVRAWVDARNAALQDGDTSAMSALSTADCRGCENFELGIEDVFSAGGSYDTPGWEVREVLPVASEVIDVRVDSAAGTTVNEAGSDPVSYPASTRDLRFTLTEAGGPRRIANIVFLAS